MYFRKTELLPGAQERSGILIRVRIEHIKDVNLQTKELGCCQGRAEQERSDPDWDRVTPGWKRIDNKGGGTTLASARALCLDLLSHVWLHISEGLNCCQESRRGVV